MCPPWPGCCVRLAELVSSVLSPNVSPNLFPDLALSFTLAGVPCPPRWTCLPICLPICLPLGFLSFTLAGVLCPPRWACLLNCLPSGFVSQFSCPICFPYGFVFHLGWGAVSASLGLSPVLSPNLFPIWLCLSPWLGCCVRLAGLASGLVSQFVSHLALSFILAGVLCPPRWACLPIMSPLQLVSHLALSFTLAGAVSASLGLSPNLSPTWLCLSSWLGAVSASLGLSPNLSPIWLCLSPWLGCCVRLAVLVCGLVSPFVSQALSFSLAGMLCPPRWACFLICLRICLPSGFVFHLGWGAVSALSPNLSRTWLRLSPWLGCCVRLAGLVSQFVSHLALSFTLSGVLCPPRWACLPICLLICLPSGLSAVLSPTSLRLQLVY